MATWYDDCTHTKTSVLDRDRKTAAPVLMELTTLRKKPYNIESGASVPALSLPCGQFHKSRKGGEKREEVLLTFLPFLKRAKGMRGGEGEKEKKVGGGGERGRRASSVEEEEEKDE